MSYLVQSDNMLLVLDFCKINDVNYDRVYWARSSRCQGNNIVLHPTANGSNGRQRILKHHKCGPLILLFHTSQEDMLALTLRTNINCCALPDIKKRQSKGYRVPQKLHTNINRMYFGE